MSPVPLSLSLRHGFPDFLDLPWDQPLAGWTGRTERLEEVARGLSRHQVVFVNYSGVLYALKEMPPEGAEKEYGLLGQIEEMRLPAVLPVGHALTETERSPASILITRFLDRALPYRSLFMRSGLLRYREHLLDAIAGLLVQLHLAGVFWGDCSLSNTLFRRDAGMLQAYLVDAETAEIYPQGLAPTLRYHDLEIMEENVDGELQEMRASGLIMEGIPIVHTGANIRLRYANLWEEITREVIINPQESYRIQERVRALNGLGFSIGEINLEGSENGDQLRLRVVVTDRNFHRDQLHGLTGVVAEERQARQMINEILELQATLSQTANQSIPLTVAAHQWLEKRYQPTLARLQPLIDEGMDPAELYYQVLEHKWYLSEQARRDVGHAAATEDYIQRFGARNEPTEKQAD
jgi:hypothetical protein